MLTFELFFFRGVEIVAKRSLQPLFHIDFIWNFTEGARRLKEYNQYGRKLFAKVKYNKYFFFSKYFLLRFDEKTNKEINSLSLLSRC